MTSSDAATRARKAHQTLEPMHVVVYFAPEPQQRYADLGIKGTMRGYFASRSAAFGVVPLEVVIATFFNFAPSLIADAIPSVWESTTPEAVLAARLDAVDAAYRRMLGDDVVASDEMAEAAELARAATTVLRVEGRPLYAAHASLPWPEPPHLQLFHAQTLLREHRGDGHIAALVLADLDPLDALITYLAHGKGQNEAMVRATRGWTDDEWDAGLARARERGLVDETGAFTPAAAAQRDEIEAQTDAAAAAPYELLGEERMQRLCDLVRPWSRSVSEQLFGVGR
ncbi:MAG: hypothetical protein JO214_11915 [Frankiaceae bacterium]|nr:hypothetical protein [Frankiaceae bacterium]